MRSIRGLSRGWSCRKRISPVYGWRRAPFALSSLAGDLKSFTLTDIGEGIAEVELLQWYVTEGDAVKQFDRICEVQSDKATVEITSRYDGVIHSKHWSVGDLVPTGSCLVDIATADDPANAAAPKPTVQEPLIASEDTATNAALTPQDSPKGSKVTKVYATPAVKRLAREHSLDLGEVLAQIQSKEGALRRVLKDDVLAFLSQRDDSQSQAHLQAMQMGEIGEVRRPAMDPPPSESYETVPVKGMLKAMVDQMNRSLNIPHMVYCDEIIMDKMVQLRTDLQPLASHQGFKLSYLPLILKATSLALLKFPILNSSLSPDETEVWLHKDHHIGIAMDTPKGLLVPNIKQVQLKSVFEIAVELNDLRERGKEGKLREADLTGGTFTLSNIGSIGGTYASPVIMNPQVAIGALSKMKKVPRFNDDGEVVAQTLLLISWGADHRIIDGGTLARFSNLWKDYLQNPASMLAESR